MNIGGSGYHLYGFSIELQSFLFVDQKILDIFALVTLKLDHLSHLCIVDDGAIARYW